MYETFEECIAALIAQRDEKYDAFNAPIVNSAYKTIGVRTPVVKKLARAVLLDCRDGVLDGFFAEKEHTYESVLFAGCLAARKGDYASTRRYLMRLVPLFGSWAHVDCVVPLLRWADREALRNDYRPLSECDGEYEKRFYIILMLDIFLTDEYIDGVLETLRHIKYGQYYVDMAAAWTLAECLVKFYDKTLPLFVTPTFPKFVHNKALQKARESYRIARETKDYLFGLKISSKKQ